MKNRFFLGVVSALLLITGCTNDEIVNEQPTPDAGEGKITITASMPNESTQTRLSLEQQAGMLAIITKWKVGDEIRFYFKQGDNFSPTSTAVTLTAENISGDGKSATFTVNVPSGIDTGAAFTVYAVHGASSRLDGANILINVSPGVFTPLNQLQDVPIAGAVTIETPGTPISITFTHLGTLQCLTVKNTSSTDFTFTPSLVNVGGTIWFYTAATGAVPYFNLTGGTVSDYDETFTPPTSTPITLSPNEDIKLAQWVRPKADMFVPEIKLNAQPPVGATIVSANSKLPRTSYMQEGRAYHLYALWNGNSLYFTDYTLTPPINPLSYVAEYNVNPAGDGFVEDLTACNVSGHFNWSTAMGINIPGYHLPSTEEWGSIVPLIYQCVLFHENSSKNNVTENVVVQGQKFSMTSDYLATANQVTYALRYKGTDLVSAWKYETFWFDTNNFHLKISSRDVTPSVTINDIAKEEFWTQATNVVRYFPGSGTFYNEGSSSTGIGTSGCFWSSTEDDWENNSHAACSMVFLGYTAGSNYSHDKPDELSVRLFTN